jgi:hypothetical protein
MARKKKFERRILRTRNRIEKRGQKMAFNAIKKQYKAVFDLVGIYQPDQLLASIDKVVTSESIMEFFINYYPMFAEIGTAYRKDVFSQKDAEDDMYESLFMQQLRSYGLVEAGKKITSITATTETFIRGAVESAVTEAVESGYGIDKTSRLIRKYLTDSLGDIGRSRAKMIAQTEMISASNQAAIYGADSTGLEYRKFWSTSGLPNIRDSHLFAEENHPNGIMKDQTFDMGDGTRMLQPGDPAGGAANVINCRCTVLIEVI